MKVIGIDVDGTLASYNGWGGIEHIEPPYPGVCAFLMKLKGDGWTICLWSTRASVYLKQWLKMYNLIDLVDYINDSPYPCDDLKRSFDVYVGDDAIRFNGDYGSVLHDINLMGSSRHWGSDTFVRDSFESDRNPTIYYKGTGKLYLDVFSGITDDIWRNKSSFMDCALLTICSHAKPYSKSWIHVSIRKHLYDKGLLQFLDYIHISSAGIIPQEASEEYDILNRYDWNGYDIKDDRVKVLLRDRIKSRLINWYNEYGKKYSDIFVYLRPYGNTYKAVIESNISCTTIPIVEYSSPEWINNPDIDDCLADPRNLKRLSKTIKALV